uniref:Ribosome assembly factor mrt4 n=1 Tax=Hemiselmis andersenii TaxID=464988 RepID=A0A6U4IQ12_HEMAN|mmetsp:Transcript_26093/g.60554  ORF Transcript_26093/g.60554 Transcript_26093/m.60554 type:complete len:216 (+) Transcript_26093:77-724(+)|eukprot:CAMPEP_0114116216 /NCGR_PEP_ID=MMETSP0043_2-20121206/4381_1 /TAXON_ID=464988 /ORGANISM="Hemiselmis andersenii, Strain CCMP644" /LENGTH=215 /DNA_ID=CAMNT_0001208525 /DNA_START=30 /DNA_END=677 /DNA_ORIENTATION=-
MPKSKRNKTVSLTKVKPGGRPKKEGLVQNVSEALDKYESIYVFKFDNLRASTLKNLRQLHREDRYFMGKNKIMQLALGRTPEEEPKENLHQLSQHLSGSSGLFCTSRPRKHIIDFFKKFVETDFARGGTPATVTHTIPAGPLPFQHTMVDQLRKLGLPVMLKTGVVTCERDHKVCTKGTPLTPEQAQVLKLLGVKTCEFRVQLVAVWENDNYTEL